MLRRRRPDVLDIDASPIESSLKDLGPLEFRLVRRTPEEVLFNGLIDHHHGPLRFSLRESTDTAVAGLKLTTRVSTRAQLLELERSSIVKALERSGGKIYGPGGAAEMLGMRPTTLTSKIAALQIKRR